MVYYYKKKFPSIDDVVIAKVTSITQYGIDVSLIEYNNCRGFINCSEVSRKKKVNFNKLLTIGKDILLHVIQVDEIKCMIDLSKRTISDDDVKLFTESHRFHIQLYNLFKQLYMKINNITLPEKINPDELHKFLCGTLFEVQTKFDNDYLLQKIINKDTNNEIIESFDIDFLEGMSYEKFKKNLDEHIDKKINRIKPELTENINLMTYSATGLADIKYILDFKSFDEIIDLEKDFEIKINYMTGSVYSIIINQKDFDIQGEKSINDVNILIKKEIKKRATEKQVQNQIVL
jgi:translation initiation factor 2 alpha subunit (eIF-2alpha)